jgi:hypothetical protein
MSSALNYRLTVDDLQLAIHNSNALIHCQGREVKLFVAAKRGTVAKENK